MEWFCFIAGASVFSVFWRWKMRNGLCHVQRLAKSIFRFGSHAFQMIIPFSFQKSGLWFKFSFLAFSISLREERECHWILTIHKKLSTTSISTIKDIFLVFLTLYSSEMAYQSRRSLLSSCWFWFLDWFLDYLKL